MADETTTETTKAGSAEGSASETAPVGSGGGAVDGPAPDATSVAIADAAAPVPEDQTVAPNTTKPVSGTTLVEGDAPALTRGPQHAEPTTAKVHEVHVIGDQPINDNNDPRAVQVGPSSPLTLPIAGGKTPEQVFAEAPKETE